MSSFKYFKIEIVSKAFFYLFIQTSASRRRQFFANIFLFCEQNSNFVLENASINTIIKSIKNDFFKTIYNDRKTTRLFFTFVILFFLFFAIICFLLSFSTFFCFSRICRFCNDFFNFNNNLHWHLRFSYLSFTSRRCQKKTWNNWEKIENTTFVLVRARFDSWLLKRLWISLLTRLNNLLSLSSTRTSSSSSWLRKRNLFCFLWVYCYEFANIKTFEIILSLAKNFRICI